MVMVSAYEALRRETREIAVRPWLYRIAHNVCLNLVRDRPSWQALDALAVDPEPGPTELSEISAELARLRRDLAALPARQRSALVLRELSGLSHREIAEALDVGPDVAKRLIREAREGLHEFALGRELVCADVRARLSDGDRRVLRARRIRAHLASCRECRRYSTALDERPRQLAALAPLPAAPGIGTVLATLGGATSPSGAGLGPAAAGASAGPGAVAGAVGAKALVAAVVVSTTCGLALVPALTRSQGHPVGATELRPVLPATAARTLIALRRSPSGRQAATVRAGRAPSSAGAAGVATRSVGTTRGAAGTPTSAHPAAGPRTAGSPPTASPAVPGATGPAAAVTAAPPSATPTKPPAPGTASPSRGGRGGLDPTTPRRRGTSPATDAANGDHGGSGQRGWRAGDGSPTPTSIAAPSPRPPAGWTASREGAASASSQGATQAPAQFAGTSGGPPPAVAPAAAASDTGQSGAASGSPVMSAPGGPDPVGPPVAGPRQPDPGAGSPAVTPTPSGPSATPPTPTTPPRERP
jgi:RNA polymerase sigma factor (sigma-70 family)